MRTIHHFIGNAHYEGRSGRTGQVFDPATGQVTAELDFANQTDVEHTIASAQAAFPEWSATPPVQRARVLFRFKALLDEHREELAALITSEHGKVHSDARG